ncbi:MAG: hypothetical protein J7J76_09365 [Candidatus Latescibacteria bacterium]|nr:hypothetical protein [Candidatus Latescibacterota bacterium]
MLLNAEKLGRPFSYKLHIYAKGGTREKVVNIADAFVHLLGLHVTKRLVLYDGDRRYLVYCARGNCREFAIIRVRLRLPRKRI